MPATSQKCNNSVNGDREGWWFDNGDVDGEQRELEAIVMLQWRLDMDNVEGVTAINGGQAMGDAMAAEGW